MRWEATGILPGMTVNFSRFGLKPPLNLAIYEMPGEHPDPRHLRSRKRYYLNVAMWSLLVPPAREKLDELIGGAEDTEEEAPQKSIRAMDVFACCRRLSESSLIESLSCFFMLFE